MVVEAFLKVLVRFLGCLGVSWGGLGGVLGCLGGVLGGLGYKGLPHAPRMHPKRPPVGGQVGPSWTQVETKNYQKSFRRPSKK